jgi:hypothetical protein
MRAHAIESTTDADRGPVVNALGNFLIESRTGDQATVTCYPQATTSVPTTWVRRFGRSARTEFSS